jgi:DNA-binding transcriptional ArsR family regulator
MKSRGIPTLTESTVPDLASALTALESSIGLETTALASLGLLRRRPQRGARSTRTISDEGLDKRHGVAKYLTIWLNVSMAKAAGQALDLAFAALADPSRRSIVARLSDSELTVGEIARPLPMSLPAVSKHLGILERAGLVARRKEGRVHHLRLVPGGLTLAEEWIAQHRAFWESRFESLEKYLRNQPARKKKPKKGTES